MFLIAPQPTFNCPECGKQFLSRHGMTRHRQTVHTEPSPEKWFVCTICKEGFHSEKQLQEHKNQKHFRKPNMEPFRCLICDKTFPTRHGLREHNDMMHLNNYTIFCNICNQGFTNPAMLNIHKKSHTDEAVESKFPFQCPYCSRRFSAAAFRDRHVNTYHSR